MTKIIPARGALNVAAMPAAAPHPTNTRMRSLESLIIWPNTDPMTEQICTVGPTRPADPPAPIVMEEVSEHTANTRLRIFPPFKTTASITRSTPFSATASGKKCRVRPMIKPPSMGMKGIRNITDPAESPSSIPSPENTRSKKSIIHRNTVDAAPASTPTIAAKISRWYSLLKKLLISTDIPSVDSFIGIGKEGSQQKLYYNGSKWT